MEFTLLQGCPLHSHSRGLLPSASPSVFSGITASWLAVCAGFFLPQALFNGQFLLPGTSSVYTLLQPSSWPPPVWHEFLLSIDQLEVLHWLHKRCPSVALVTSCFHLAVRMVFHLLPHQLTVLPHHPGPCPGSCWVGLAPRLVCPWFKAPDLLSPPSSASDWPVGVPSLRLWIFSPPSRSALLTFKGGGGVIAGPVPVLV